MFLRMNSQKHSWTSQATSRLPHFVPHVFSDESSKTFRMRRSLEGVGFSESSSILVSRKRDKQIDMRSCLSVASSLSDLKDLLFRPPRQDVLENLSEETALLLDSDFSGAVAAVMVLVVDDAELAGGDTVDRSL